MTIMDVTVQWVRTTWTKRSRGAPLSEARNRAPKGFVLPADASPLLHEVLMLEHDGFVPHFAVTEGLPEQERLHLHAMRDTLKVQLADGFGVPVRSHRPSVVIRRGEWVRWQMNNRSPGVDLWFYDLLTVNIAFGSVARDAFLGVPPHHVDELAVLR